MARLPGAEEVVTRIITEYDRAGMDAAVAEMKKMRGASEDASGSGGKLERQLGRLTSPAEFAAAGLRRVGNVLQGMAFGAVIGGVSALTQVLLDHFKQSFSTREEMDSLSNSVMSQATAWKLLPDPMKAVTKESVELFNAQLKVLQLTAEQEIPSLEQKLLKLVDLRAEAVKNKGVWTEFGEVVGDNSRVIAIYDLEIAKLSKDIRVQQGFLGMHETSVDKATESLLKMKEALKTPEGENLFTAFVGGTLAGPAAQKMELDAITFGGRIGESFANAVAWGIEKKKNSLDIVDLTFSMGELLDSSKPPKPPELPEEDNIDDMLLDRHLARLDFKHQAEKDYFAKRVGITQESFSALAEYDDMLAAREQAGANIRAKANQALQEQYLKLVATGKFSVGAFAQIVAQQVKVELAGLAARSTVWAIYETAMGLKATAAGIGGDPKAAAEASAHFASAAEFATTAGMALAGAAVTQALFGGGAEQPAPGTVGGPPIITQGSSAVPERLEPVPARPQIVLNIEHMELLDENSVIRLMDRMSNLAEKYDVTMIATGIA